MSVIKIRMKYRFVFFLFVGILLSIMSCNKTENSYDSFHRGMESSKQYVDAQQMMTQIMNTYFKSITDSLLLNTGTSWVDAANIRQYNDTLNHLIIEYPAWGNEDGYGHYRQGIIEATTNAGFLETNAIVNIRFINFLYDLSPLAVDSMVLVNQGKVDGKNQKYKLDAKRIEMHYADSSGIFSFSMNEMFTVYKAAGTFYTSHKDSIGIYGNLNGTTKNNLVFDAECVEDSAMLYAYSCNWLKGGPVNLETKDFKYTSILYFSEPDTCANLFLIEMDNNPFTSPIEEY